MAKARVFYLPKAKKYTLTATTEATDHPVENVLNPYPQNTWQSTTNGDQYVTFASATSRNVRCIFIGNHNITSYTTFQVQASNNDFATHDDTTVTSYSETRFKLDAQLEPGQYTIRHAYVLIDSSHNYTDYRIKINSSISYYEIGFIGLYIGDYSFDANFMQRFQAGFIQQKDIIEGYYGHTTSKYRYMRFEAFLEFKNNLSKTQCDLLTGPISLSKTCIFVPEDITTGIYLGEITIDNLPENLQAISTDNKSISIKFIEKI